MHSQQFTRNWLVSEKPSSGKKVGCSRFFFRAERPEIVTFLISRNCGGVLVETSVHAAQSQCALSDGAILRIQRVSRCAQVLPLVVHPVPVAMINLRRKWFVTHEQPSHSVIANQCPINSNKDIPMSFTDTARRVSGINDSATAVTPYFPSDDASAGIVSKKFARACCGKIGLSHDAFLSLIGKSLHRATTLCGLAYFTAWRS